MMTANLATKSYFALCAVGEAIAIIHAYQELTANFRFCSINSTFSCGNVFASGYVSIFGVPFYLLGLIWFPLVAIVGLLLSRGGKGIKSELPVPLLMIGNIFTVYLWYLELFRIGALCPVCISMYAINYALTFICLKIALT
jgi:uncharacterized membrane protein